MDLHSRSIGINHLPTELLNAIFKLLVEPIETTSLPWINPLGRRYGPETVANVCSRWRRIAFDTPSIWSHLYISDAWSKEKMASYWQEMCLRAAGSAINVTVVDVNIPEIDEDLPSFFISLLNSVPRLGHLRIVIGDTKAAGWAHTLFQGLEVKPTSFTVQTPLFPSRRENYIAGSPPVVKFWGGLILTMNQIFGHSHMSQLTELTLDGVVAGMSFAPIDFPLQMGQLRRIWIKQPREHEMAPFVLEDLLSLPKLEELHLYVTFNENWIIEGDPVTPVAPLRSLYLSQYFPIMFLFEKSAPVLPNLTSFGAENVERDDLLAFLSANPTIIEFTLPTSVILELEDWDTHRFRSLDVPGDLDIDPLLQHPTMFPNITRLRLVYNPDQASKYTQLVETRCQAEERPRIPLLTIEVEEDDVKSSHGVLSQIAGSAMDSWRREDGQLWHFFFD